MAPPTKITKDDILKASLSVIRKGGLGSLTAKSVSNELNCSTQPIFWVFGTIQNLIDEVRIEATKIYDSYYAREIKGLPRFKTTGMNYIIFAAEEPEIFKLLFMSDRSDTKNINELTLDANKPQILRDLRTATGLSEVDAYDVYIYMWLFSHGIASLIVSGTVNISFEYVGKALTNVFTSLINKYKENNI